jgi:Amt family ammonium transporter
MQRMIQAILTQGRRLRWLRPLGVALAATAAAAALSSTALAQGDEPFDAQAAYEETKLAINLMWMMSCAFIVFLMQVGFALVEAGFTRAKNVVHTMMMNLLVFCIAALGYWAVGFALQFGAVNATLPGVTTAGALQGDYSHAPITLGNWGNSLSTPLLAINPQVILAGGSGFGLNGLTLTAGVLTFFVFQMVFMDTAATIPTGSLAERFKFSGFCLMALFISMFLYPVVGGWIWGGGWLQNLGRITGLGNGVVDFAGSGVVHMVGGMLALVGAIVAGPRKGRFGPDGRVNPMPGHNIPLGVVGSIILFFGWFGFNSGSSYGMTGAFGQLAANAALNTLLAGAAGGSVGMVLSWMLSDNRKPDVTFVVNSMLGALAGITTSCAFVESGSAVLIGSISGLLTYGATRLLERLRIDDPAGAAPVHLVNGIWGMVAVGLFGAGLPITRGWNGMDRAVTGLFYGSTGQLSAQLIGAVTILVFVGLAGLAFFMVLKASDLLRPSARDEQLGLDVTEMGMAGYNDDGALSGQPERKADPKPAPGVGFDPQRAWSIVTGGAGAASLIPPGLPAPRPDMSREPAPPPSTRPKSNLSMKERAAMLSADQAIRPAQKPPANKTTDPKKK